MIRFRPASHDYSSVSHASLTFTSRHRGFIPAAQMVGLRPESRFVDAAVDGVSIDMASVDAASVDAASVSEGGDFVATYRADGPLFEPGSPPAAAGTLAAEEGVIDQAVVNADGGAAQLPVAADRSIAFFEQMSGLSAARRAAAGPGPVRDDSEQALRSWRRLLSPDGHGFFARDSSAGGGAPSAPAWLSELTASPGGLFPETSSAGGAAPPRSGQSTPSGSVDTAIEAVSAAPAAAFAFDVQAESAAAGAGPAMTEDASSQSMAPAASLPEVAAAAASPVSRAAATVMPMAATTLAAEPAAALLSAEDAAVTTLAADTTPDGPPPVVHVDSISSEIPSGPVVPMPPGVDTEVIQSDPVVTVQTGAPNKITIENAKQGNPRSEWAVDGDGDGNIQGFATQISTNIGGTVDFKIATDSTHYRLDIYRMGYYGGDGARKVATIDKSLTSAQVQPHPIVDMSRGLIDAGNWSVSASWEIPSDAVSGVYFAKLVREDGTEGSSIVPFIVRDDASTSDIVFQTSDTTWQAYNAWGGASLYFGEVPVDPANLIGYMPPNCSCGVTAIGRATAVSYNRPIVTNTSPIGGTHDYIFGVEASAIQWLEQNGYDVSYISGVDTARSGASLMNHEAFLSVGHDEYWSAEQRANVEAARDAGVDLAFWGGNDMYWKVRWETSIDGNGTAYRTMVSYKDTWGTTSDPTGTATGTWRDPNNAAPGQEPENALIGTMFQVDAYRQDAITVSSDYSKLRFWRDTDVADLQAGQSLELSKNILGYEWNSDVENGYRPAGLINMSLTTVSVDTYLRDYGTSVGAGNATHSLTMYRDAESGALVFSAGTVFWSWGLNADHEGPATETDPNVQQAMVNMFADMGIQPSTLDASLILATQSTDHIRPTSSITAPNIGSTFLEGQRVTITGTAQDNGGGVVAGVEVSTDGGAHWFKATGRESWSFDWVVQASGSYTIMSRAVDDSLNLETPSAGKQVSVTLPATTGLWTMASKPTVETAPDRDGVELGVRFQATNGGLVQGIRFYKGFYNVGSHPVSLWTADGTLLATAVATGESLSGWQTVTFSSPVAIAAGTTYVASYHSDGFYSVDDGYFDAGYSNGQITVQPGGSVFAYGAAGTFPTSVPTGNSSGSNYWVDVVLDAGPNTTPVAVDDSGLLVAMDTARTFAVASLLANDNDPDNDALKIVGVGQALNGTVSFNQAIDTITFSPTAGYTGAGGFSYTISDGRGGTSEAEVSLSIEDAAAGVSVFQPGDGPSGPANSGAPVELGMKFVTSTNGTITGLKFYKAAADSGSHTGTLWSATGTALATVTFVNETASGWQTAVLSNPVPVTAGTTYVASYHTTGTYVASGNYFATSHGNGTLTAPSSASSGGNGLYAYSSSSVFPTSSYNATNYWVDVVFNNSMANVAPVAVNDNGLGAVQNTPRVFAFSELLANDTDANGDILTITDVGNASNGTVSIDLQAATITFTPTEGYLGPAGFTYVVSDGHGGSASASASISVSPPSTAVSLYGANDTPAATSVSDGNPVELGVKFVASAAGTITGLRYYKSAQDSGTHTGSLWSSNGTLLASVTFLNETASGWQTATFSQPVTIAAGTTYVASYQSNGSYAATSNYFSTSHSNGPLTAPSSGASGGNGLYAYGSGNEFPNQSYNATNYWVDVVYEPAGNLAPVAVNDGGLSTQSDTPLVIQASTLLANDSDPNGDALAVTGVSNASNGTAVFDAQSNTITFTPTSGYTGAAAFSYAISDGHSGTASAQVSLSILPQGQAPAQSVFSASSTPAIVSVADTNPVNLGMKFQADVSGWVTDIRFYKAAENTGAHTGYLWTSTGTLIASVSFSNETASGWQQATLDTPVAIDADTTYVVSYSTNGHYSATPQGLGSEVSSGNLHALSSALSGGNGVYAYGAAGAFPGSSYNATNYYVDVVFRPQLAA